MRRYVLALTLALAVLSSEFSVLTSASPGIVTRTLAPAGGRNAIVAVLPQSSESAKAPCS